MSRKSKAPTNYVLCEDVGLDIENDFSRIQEAVNELRSFVTEEKNLKVRMDDVFMLRYLRASDFDPKKAFDKMRPWKKLQLHVINTSTLVDMIVKVVYPFLSSSFKERIFFHGNDFSSLHKYVDPEVLPREYGGGKTEIDYGKMQKYLCDNEEKLMELCSLGYIST
ncbi:hypothetical protein L9F63_001564 [Diploptera punctata]|uniref:CRAL-TRIO domain-containing protein n=1 Tax=Diploptera punctata TaxID=6984 RepID=A0AAD8A3K8_DIPPU|nr:hypothetical protein L9F63_001564 [Diploptera punctata]